MKHISTIVTTLVFAAALLLIPPGYSQTFDSKYQDGKVYIKFKDSQPVSFIVNNDGSVPVSSVRVISQLSGEFNIKSLSRPFDYNNDQKLLRTLQLEIEEFNKIEELISRLQKDSTIEYVEKVPVDRIDYLPNDSLYNLYNGLQNWNWHLELIQAELAWNITRGNPDIKIAIVDNAVWVDHPDLASKVIVQRDVVYGTNSANPPTSGDPGEWSHGTHVAGLIGASSNNNIGVASIGYNVSLIAVKASNNTNPVQITGAYSGIQWAANNGANVINMSWGGTGFSQTNQNLINTIAASGVVLIAAAGNENTSAPHYPSAYQNVISVASIDWNDEKSSFSNFSTTVDISSPGGVASPGPAGLLSTTFSNNNLGYYDSYPGTSMACPVVSGVAGLILSINPALTPAEVEEILKSTSDDINLINPNYTTTLGTGRVNAFKAVSRTPFQPTASFKTSVEVITPGTTINFIDQSTGVPSTWQWSFEGGNPSTSNDTIPTGITYNTPGSYDVTLTVSNDFGSSSVTINDYIQVVTDPSPYVFMNVSDSAACIAEVVTLYDSSLYEPTSWEWAIEPETYEFVNGTSSSSQNAEVEFLSQGYYNITLTAYNQNGSSSRLFENAIHVKGIIPNYVLDMEEGNSEYFELWDTIKSQSAVDHRAANNSIYGIHFHGDPIPVGWKGSPSDGTSEQVWNENLAFHAEAHLCGVDARNLTNLKLAFDLRQTYSLGPKYSWFRVLVNGAPFSSYEGIIDYNPVTASDDEWKRIEYDLSALAGTVFDITLQASNRFSDKTQGAGDNVFIDNLEITINVPVDYLANPTKGIQIFPNPATRDGNIIVKNTIQGSVLEIMSIQGKLLSKFDLNTNDDELKIGLSDLLPGLYIVSVSNNQKTETAKLLIIDSD